LLAQGAATRGELLRAQTELNSTQFDLLTFEQRQRQQLQAGEGEARAALRESGERQWLESRLQSLTLSAQSSGRVLEILVNLGESVGPGTLLMRLEQAGEPQLLIYLDPRYNAYATPGQVLEVQMPGGRWLAAHVLSAADSAQRLPSNLQRPFAASQMSLLVPAAFDQPLPAQWHVQQLPLRVRFRQDWWRTLGLHD
jgi:multidrug efflux pump subunit AcrA (membrane-fusion protein)